MRLLTVSSISLFFCCSSFMLVVCASDADADTHSIADDSRSETKRNRSRVLKGSSRYTWDDSMSLTMSTSALKFRSLQELTMEDLEDRKRQPVASKDDMRLSIGGSWRDNLVLSHHPSSAPSVTARPTTTPSNQPTSKPSSSPTIMPTINDEFIAGQLVVGAYYYPWHADDFHNDEGYLRDDLDPRQQPVLGEYDDREESVVTQHLRWSRQANINLWVTSWWGPGSQSDQTTLENILPHPKLRNHKIALFYETLGRIRPSEDYSLQRVESDMQHMCTNFFDHPNYYTVTDLANGPRPVVFMYLSRHLANRDLLRVTTELMRETVRNACGKELFIVGDQVFGFASEKDFINNPRHYSAFQLLDAVTNYDVYGSVAQIVGNKGGTLTQSQVQEYYQGEQTLWKQAAEQYNCQFIPSVSPGYNDLSVRPQEENPPLSRALAGQDRGSVLREALKYAIPLADTSSLDKSVIQPNRVLMVNSFNEWHEDTQIEPVVGNPASFPDELTFGFEYEGYGDKYLEILRVGTEKEIDGLLR
ncbi:unnamed protein product [Cylindrotheca closterium]|uniref:Uncharacterized protein n=1 Tax=Cylindrotheca closterium TaxID=2856 RepID=A0AAD2FND9_9STRA|nr:unnamed protein product [Cylindrotheca closterium]